MFSGCGGVTQEPLHGNEFTLRKGSILKKSPSAEISWLKYCYQLTNSVLCENKGTYLSGYTDGGRKAYNNLNDAQAACTKTKGKFMSRFSVPFKKLYFETNYSHTLPQLPFLGYPRMRKRRLWHTRLRNRPHIVQSWLRAIDNLNN